ncbi:MAG: hypothetical protein ACM3JH_14625 [Acidithiobacillales bacterium]
MKGLALGIVVRIAAAVAGSYHGRRSAGGTGRLERWIAKMALQATKVGSRTV